MYMVQGLQNSLHFSLELHSTQMLKIIVLEHVLMHRKVPIPNNVHPIYIIISNLFQKDYILSPQSSHIRLL